MDEHTSRRIRAYLETAIELEAESGWARMRRVPSTYTWKILDYVSSLPADRRTRLFEAFVANAMHFFDPGRSPSLHAYQSGHEEYRALVEALPRTGGWEYVDARMLRAILGDIRSPKPSPEFSAVPDSVIARAEAIHPTSAGEIRKAVKQIFGDRFGAKPENRKGGNWRYAGAHDGRAFTVSIDYGGMGDQLRYDVAYDAAAKGMRVRGISCERMLGVGLGHWDFVTADNLAESATLLADLVAELVTIPDRV